MPERESPVMVDWTVDPVTNRSNSSAEYFACVRTVEGVIRGSANDLIAGRANIVAGLIVAALARQHGLAPRQAAVE